MWTLREAVLVSSLAFIGAGFLLLTLALRLRSALVVVVEERTEEEAEPAVVQAAAPVLVAEPVKHLGATEELGLAGFVAVALEFDETPAGDLLCDQPKLPPHGSEEWLSIRLAAMRHRPVSWRRLDTAIGAEWAELVTTRAKTLEATQEIGPETLAKVLGGTR
jgi:hypothetical protein